MNIHNALYHGLKRATASPLDLLEAEARLIWPRGAELGSLYVLKSGNGFIYEWGGINISRREAALRAEGRAA